MEPRHPNVGTVGHIDHGKSRHPQSFAAQVANSIQQLPDAPIPFKPTHWPPRLTRMALAVRMGTTRMLLECRP